MSPPKDRKIIINKSTAETRIAVLEDDCLVEIDINRHLLMAETPSAGDIYMGRIRKVDTSLNAAFVDLGGKQDGFLRAQDAMPPSGLAHNKHSTPPINQSVYEGEKILVQIESEPQNEKGPRVKREISFATKNLVYLPLNSGVKVSARIKPQSKADKAAEELTRRIADLTEEEAEPAGGYIVRTDMDKADTDEITFELRKSWARWRAIEKQINRSDQPGKLSDTEDGALRKIEPFLDKDLSSIICDHAQLYRDITAKAESDPRLKNTSIHHHTSREPVFEAYEVEPQFEQALNRTVPLKTNGQIIIDQTEAMTVIDVDSGQNATASAWQRSDEKACAVNCEAVDEIARQIRLRSISGLIVIDFIHMNKKSYKDKVLAKFKAALKSDPQPSQVADMSRFGLVEMTRRRSRPSLLAQLYEHPTSIYPELSLSSLAADFYRRLEREMAGAGRIKVSATVSKPLFDWLTARENHEWPLVQKHLGTPVDLGADETFARHRFEIE